MRSDESRRIGRFFWLKVFIMIIFVSLIFNLAWYGFFSYEKCDSWECFNDNLDDCRRTKFVGGNEMVFSYRIEGSEEGKCVVNVKMLQGDFNNQDSLNLVDNEMKCFLPLGIVMIPESNIAYCHGLLKEGLQDLVIEKMHAYIVQNLGKINAEAVSGVALG
jgi:hypothetical protein